MHGYSRSTFLACPLAKASIGEAEHAVTPPVLLGLSSDGSARHLRNHSSLAFPQTNVARSIDEGPGVGEVKVLANQSGPSLLIEPQIESEIHVESHAVGGKQVVVGHGVD